MCRLDNRWSFRFWLIFRWSRVYYWRIDLDRIFSGRWLLSDNSLWCYVLYYRFRFLDYFTSIFFLNYFSWLLLNWDDWLLLNWYDWLLFNLYDWLTYFWLLDDRFAYLFLYLLFRFLFLFIAILI